MKRLLAVPFAALLALPLAACGGDDDDDAAASASASVAAAAGDFCEIWPSFNEDSTTLGEGEMPTEEQLEEARELLDSARASAPEEIEDEVGQMVDAVEGIVDQLAEGEEPDAEEMFGTILGLAFEVGPKIEEWLVDNCPDYEPQGGFSSDGGVSGSAFEEDVFEGGLLGLSAADAAAIFNEAFPEGQLGYSSSGDSETYEYEVTIDGDADAALTACETLANGFADHPDFTGELKLTIRQYVSGDDPDTEEVEFDFAEGEVLVTNESITPGDAGRCVAA